ncbi:flavin reductase family protein [Glutamicibacter protophormiae]
MTTSTAPKESSTRVSGQDLREAMRVWTTGTTIVTAREPGGQRIGLVSNSFTSVSLNPPLVSWCVDKGSSAIDAWKAAEAFSVHILADGQEHWIRKFATRGADKFQGVETASSLLGTPVLAIPGTRMDCRVVQLHEAGDHYILLGQVHRIEER